MGLVFSIVSPPVYGAGTANAWNLERASTDLNFYFSTSGTNPSALQLNQNGQMRARSILDLDNGSYVIDPSGNTSNPSVMGGGLRIGESTTLSGTANALTIRRAGADSAVYQTLINEGTTTHTIRSGGAGLRKDLVFTNDAGGNYSFSGSVTGTSGIFPAGLTVNSNGTRIEMPEISTNTSYSGFGAGGTMSDGVPWYWGIGREPGAWGFPYPDLIVNNHAGLLLSAHGNHGGVSIYEELNPAGTTWQAKGTEVARFRDDRYGGSYISTTLGIGTTSPKGKFAVNFGNGDQLIVYQPSDDKLALQTTLNDQPNNGYGGDPANRLLLQPVTGQVGIGTQNPNRKLDISTDSGNDGLTIGQQRDNSTTIQTYIDNHWPDRATYASGCCNDLLLQPDVGSVGIGTASPAYKLHVGGGTGNGHARIEGRVGINGYAVDGCGGNYGLCVGGTSGGQSIWNNTSDARLKENIVTIPNALDKVKALRGVYFDFKNLEGVYKTLPKGHQIGFIAQEVEPILPEVVTTGTDGMKMMGYGSVTALLTEAIKEQQTQLEAEKARNDQQQAEIEQLKLEIKNLKNN